MFDPDLLFLLFDRREWEQGLEGELDESGKPASDFSPSFTLPRFLSTGDTSYLAPVPYDEKPSDSLRPSFVRSIEIHGVLHLVDTGGRVLDIYDPEDDYPF
ncbi:hypothetical protein J4410_00120 [Candidatus Woesearchaeota archaeon]|nr:hypothetical protein [Candidatus Woesearchaeota archaeon]